jgi:hypothetical protein
MFSLKSLAVSGVCAASLLAAVPAMAGPTTSSIAACVNTSTGAVRIVASLSDCVAGETGVTWAVSGPVGPQGPVGPAGITGAPGSAGPAGAPGPAGATGPIGATGATGATGAAGPIGPAGATGAVGATGAIGPIGPAGATGPAGAIGPAGATGAAGPVGPAGPAGATGAFGPAGPVGPAGPSGPTGPAGATGPQGPAGTIPAALTKLNTLYTEPWGGTGAGSYEYGGVTCTLGDMVLSVNGYGAGAALPADGRLLPIAEYTAVFSIMGTNFGGNGTTNFALPDLRNLAPPGLYWSVCMEGIFPSRD